MYFIYSLDNFSYLNLKIRCNRWIVINQKNSAQSSEFLSLCEEEWKILAPFFPLTRTFYVFAGSYSQLFDYLRGLLTFCPNWQFYAN